MCVGVGGGSEVGGRGEFLLRTISLLLLLHTCQHTHTHIYGIYILFSLLLGGAARFRITPAPYEKAQAFEEICKRAAYPKTD